jgi:hypothetical protein
VTIVNGVRLISNSEVQTFKDCPRKWWLAWHRGLVQKRESPVGAASTGQRYHAAVAELYVPDGETPGDPLAKLDELHAETLAALPDHVEDGGGALGDKLTDNDQHAKLLKAFDLERAMVEGYLQWLEQTGADAQLEVIAAETYVEADFPAHRPGFAPNYVKLIGKLDARTRNRVTGGIRFIDHKTVGSLFDPMLKLNQQMLHYHLIEDLTRDPGTPRCEGALYNMARKVKRTRAATPPFYGRVPIPHNDWELQNYAQQLRGTIAKMVQAEIELSAGTDHHYAVPSRPSRDCSWKCPFFKICHMFDDGSRVEAAVENLYEVRDPLSYYGGREKGGDSID